MDQLTMVAEKQAILLKQLRAGELFESLPDLLKAIRDELHYEKATPVSPILSEDELMRQMVDYQNLWSNQDDGVSAYINDEDLRRFVNLLSSPKESVRDTGAFFFLGNAIQNGHLNSQQLGWLTAEVIADNRLFAHLLEEENDGAFYRSYCVAILAILLNENLVAEKPFITSELLEALVGQLGMYLLLEKDTRGYLADHGWVHIYTHLANALGLLFDQKGLKRADKLYLLGCLMTNLRLIDTPLTMGEQGRLVGTILNLTKRHELYADYLLLSLKLWRQDLVNEPFTQSRASWQMLYNRVDFFQQILAYGPDASPEEIWQYAQSTKNYLS
ncbi:DUF2785 domain-containing protein [Fructobacillus sp. M1-13]|uniref:DUF2785 domain-containing protein n=1 Tax=Fructobacillus papyriferae TaxID=2713171 RepID=A0ABS5QT02_9LACO|nr:DUF2785 domain-containing protein [Fructobacillus papyriferae]MBS9335615.1 DUF2785 domain-containing protein [Fructobacillus papyriferae]MCD2159296.1 DUF2785 domain-containing protein [Fructobacillus papyriferae]